VFLATPPLLITSTPVPARPTPTSRAPELVQPARLPELVRIAPPAVAVALRTELMNPLIVPFVFEAIPPSRITSVPVPNESTSSVLECQRVDQKQPGTGRIGSGWKGSRS
jgi:hypothetical protein